jgi:D-glycero-beta-D-manno-heptose-7-phosphate kinase
MVALSKALASFIKKDILVVGDLILDKYVLGTSKRISPEAPVPVVVVEREEKKAGGAGNVILNLLSMGMQPHLLARVGDDEAGDELVALLKYEGVNTDGVFLEPGYCTPVKKRIIVSSQQVVRVDKEKYAPLSLGLEDRAIAALDKALDGISLILISDYGKGFLERRFLCNLIAEAQQRKIPCIADPKGTDFSKYSGSLIIKPNAHETLNAAPACANSTIDEAAYSLLQQLDIDYLMVTRSEEGISLFHKGGNVEHFPVVRKEVLDVTGAGDTVLAMLGAALASGVPIYESVCLSNLAASCAVERLGCARISLYDVACKLIEQNPSGKICPAEHFKDLLATLKSEKLLMLHLKSRQIEAEEIIRLAHLASSTDGRRAIACFEHPIDDPRLLNLIASLQSIDLVVHGCGQLPSIKDADHLIVIV